jgi:hypothetical protein
MLAGNHGSSSTVTMWRGAPSRFASVKAVLSARKGPGEQSWARELFELSKGAKGSTSPVHAGHKPAQRIGAWTVTSFVPSGKVASTWIWWIISGTPSMT